MSNDSDTDSFFEAIYAQLRRWIVQIQQGTLPKQIEIRLLKELECSTIDEALPRLKRMAHI